MATMNAIRNEPTNATSPAGIDMRLEVVVIPVSDVDRAKEFYTKLGWRLDAEFAAGDEGGRLARDRRPHITLRNHEPAFDRER